MKGQIGLEGMVAVVLVLLLFVVIAASVLNNQLVLTDTRNALDAQETCLQLERETTNLFTLGDGAAITVYLNNEVQVANRSLTVDRSRCHSCCALTNGTSDQFVISRGFVTLTNSGGNLTASAPAIPPPPAPPALHNTTVFFDGFEQWGAGNCAYPSGWTACFPGDGSIKRTVDEFDGTFGMEFSDHDADTNLLVACVDLTPYTNAYVTFWWKKKNLGAGEYGKLSINTSITGFVEIFTSGTGTSAYDARTIDITAYRSSQTCIKFHALLTGNSEHLIDNVEILGES